MNLLKRTWLIVVILLAVSITARAISPTNLKCEYHINPLGIDIVKPLLSWISASTERGWKQTAYQILVASSSSFLDKNQGDLWNSGKLDTDCSNQIVYEGKVLSSRLNCYWKVKVWDNKGKESEWSAPAYWSMGLLHSEEWKAQWIGIEQPKDKMESFAQEDSSTIEPLPTPRYLRKNFKIKNGIRRATVYATALGVFEMHINGKRVGENILAPEWTDYNKRIQYQTFDVTELVEKGENTIGAILGNGWYCGHWQFWQPKLKQIYGKQPFFKAQLEIETNNGELIQVVTDQTWRGTIDGPLRFSGIYEGEIYDSRKTLKAWDTKKYNDKHWGQVLVDAPRSSQLVWQRSEPIRVSQELTPISVTETKPGVYVFDLGQNMNGWVRLNIDEPKGTQLKLRLNEMLNPDGSVYMENLHAGKKSKGDRQIIRFICGGGKELFEPHFTYFGFRYVEVHGLTKKPDAGFITGRVFHTGMSKVGSFTCSNKLINKLVENIQWSQRANIMGIPTDCNQRDERCGYTGDMNFFAPTAVYNFDMSAFLNKWLFDVQDAQQAGGWYADHAPFYGPGRGPNIGWSDAGITTPYQVWRTYGDTRAIRENYTGMKKFLQWFTSNTKDSIFDKTKVGNGDWLNIGGGASKDVIGNAYAANDFKMMAEMAEAIGETADAASFRQQFKVYAQSFAKKFITPEGEIRESSQTGYALAFTMGLIPDSLFEKVSGKFISEIEKKKWHLATGFIGTPRLLPALHLAGRDDVAYRVLLQKDYPSWLYPVNLGATTMWERWNGWLPNKGFADSRMNSFNHYSFGAVGEYLFGMIGGIRETSPGFHTFQLAPVISDSLQWSACEFESIYGKISSKWTQNANELLLNVTIPANTNAEILIPTSSTANVFEENTLASKAVNVRFVSFENGKAKYRVESGKYSFKSLIIK